jgi:hypothetical protein
MDSRRLPFPCPCAAVRGSAVLRTSARPTVAGSTPSFGTPTSASGSGGRLPPESYPFTSRVQGVALVATESEQRLLQSVHEPSAFGRRPLHQVGILPTQCSGRSLANLPSARYVPESRFAWIAASGRPSSSAKTASHVSGTEAPRHDRPRAFRGLLP